MEGSTPNDLTNKVALITGGGRRLGAAIARQLHAEGMNIVVAYRNSKGDAHALQQELNALRPNSLLLVQGDVLNVAKLGNLISDTLQTWGRLDALINNASSFYPTPVGQVTEANWDDLMGTNLKAPFFLSQAAAPQLRKHKGCIVNMVDIHAERPLKHHPLYCAAKAGLAMITKSLARDLAPEVRVNALAPGTILWPPDEHNVIDDVTKQRILSRIPLKRCGTPEEIARAVRFLVKDATYTTGQIIPVCGGRTVVG